MKTEFNMLEYTNKLINFVDPLSRNEKTGGKVDLSNENSALQDFDEITEKAEAEREMIDSRIEDLWKDMRTVCRIISENSEAIDYAVQTESYESKAVEKIITNAMRAEVISDLNL